MAVIAEISDKMLTVPWLRATMALFALPPLLALIRRWLAWTLLPLSFLLSGWMVYGAYHEAFVDSGMREAIHLEMGAWWIFNSIASPLLPAVAGIAVLGLTMMKKRSPNQASEGMPRKLGNPEG